MRSPSETKGAPHTEMGPLHLRRVPGKKEGPFIHIQPMGKYLSVCKGKPNPEEPFPFVFYHQKAPLHQTLKNRLARGVGQPQNPPLIIGETLLFVSPMLAQRTLFEHQYFKIPKALGKGHQNPPLKELFFCLFVATRGN